VGDLVLAERPVIGNTMRKRNRLPGALLASTLLVSMLASSCAHASYTLYVTNETDNPLIVRANSGPGYADSVYRVPPGSTAQTLTRTGGFSGRVEILDASCAVLEVYDFDENTTRSDLVRVTRSRELRIAPAPETWASDPLPGQEVETCAREVET
jgi:hypothetical protein